MITHKEELLSAFVDAEISELEVRRVCKELLSDERELARWSRYHLVRDAMRGNLPAATDLDFAARVMAKIEQEPLPTGRGMYNWRYGLLKPAAGFGLAASIAVIAVVGVQSLTDSPSSVANIAQVSPAPSLAQRDIRPISVGNAQEGALVENPEVAARLNSYLVNHSEYAPSHGVMPYARVVIGYDTSQP